MERDTDWHGEAGYVNCLLTTLSEGPRSEADVESDVFVPSLTDLAEGNDDLHQWASQLTFDYRSLNSGLIVAMLLHLAGFRWYSWFKRQGRIQSVLVKDGKPLVQSIVIARGKKPSGASAVHVAVGNSGG